MRAAFSTELTCCIQVQQCFLLTRLNRSQQTKDSTGPCKNSFTSPEQNTSEFLLKVKAKALLSLFLYQLAILYFLYSGSILNRECLASVILNVTYSFAIFRCILFHHRKLCSDLRTFVIFAFILILNIPKLCPLPTAKG